MYFFPILSLLLTLRLDLNNHIRATSSGLYHIHLLILRGIKTQDFKQKQLVNIEYSVRNIGNVTSFPNSRYAMVMYCKAVLCRSNVAFCSFKYNAWRVRILVLYVYYVFVAVFVDCGNHIRYIRTVDVV